jgi:drug/metabolite transporter (DMT)-like permease
MLGLSPVFGKQAILVGLDPLSTVALRTIGAAALLFFVLAIFRRGYFYIYPIGLAGCALAGLLNGLGSVFFYAALGRIDASLGQFLFTLYPIFVAGLVYLDGRRSSKLTIVRLVISVIGVLLLTQRNRDLVDIVGVIFMLTAALLYALHIPINQRVLYEVPAPTVTFYTLLAMALVVLPIKVIGSGFDFKPPAPALQPIFLLTLATFVSRLTLFEGVKAIGSIQTALFGLLELLVTVVFALLLLGESLSTSQWAGAILLATTLLLTAFEEDIESAPFARGWLFWLRAPATFSQQELDGADDV